MDKQLVGLWPVMLTFFKDNGKLDIGGIEALTDFYINAGSEGLFANCLSSEMFDLSDDERIEIVKTIVQRTNNRIPVVATGTFSRFENTNIIFIKRIFDAGVNAVIINSNQLNYESANENDFRKSLDYLINKTLGIPLGIYECPVPYKRFLSPVLMKWLAECGRFFYLKDTSCDIIAIKEKLKAVEGSNLKLYNANVPTGLDSLKMGANGLSSIGANYFPEVYNFLIRNYDEPAMTENIRKLNALLCEIDPLLHKFYPFSAKLFLRKRGMKISSYTRTAVSEINNDGILKLEELNKILNEISDEFGIEKVL